MLTKGFSVKVIGILSVLSCPIKSKTLSFISFAALFVNVIAKIFEGFTPFLIKFKILWVIVLVLPAPAPASIRTGPSSVSTASFCLLLSPFIIIIQHYNIFTVLC